MNTCILDYKLWKYSFQHTSLLGYLIKATLSFLQLRIKRILLLWHLYKSFYRKRRWDANNDTEPKSFFLPKAPRTTKKQQQLKKISYLKNLKIYYMPLRSLIDQNVTKVILLYWYFKRNYLKTQKVIGVFDWILVRIFCMSLTERCT